VSLPRDFGKAALSPIALCDNRSWSATPLIPAIQRAILGLMKRTDLVAALDDLGIDPRAYWLGEGPRDERYCLEDQRSTWAVYYSERGLRTGERHFGSEHEACTYLLTLIDGDPTTRRSR